MASHRRGAPLGEGCSITVPGGLIDHRPYLEDHHPAILIERLGQEREVMAPGPASAGYD